MDSGDRKSFYQLVGDVYGFYRIDITPFAYNVWWEACKGFDFAAVADAFNRHAVNPDQGQFLPKPADIVKLIGGTSIDAAQTAWSKVDRALRSVGTYQSVVFDDALIHHVLVDMGGWTALGTKDDDAWPFVQREFETRYRGYRTAPPQREVPKLVGVFEAHNALGGHKVEPPVLLGDPAKAASVLGRVSDAPRLTVTRLSDVVSLPRLVDGSKAA